MANSDFSGTSGLALTGYDENWVSCVVAGRDGADDLNLDGTGKLGTVAGKSSDAVRTDGDQTSKSRILISAGSFYDPVYYVAKVACRRTTTTLGYDAEPSSSTSLPTNIDRVIVRRNGVTMQTLTITSINSVTTALDVQVSVVNTVDVQVIINGQIMTSTGSGANDHSGAAVLTGGHPGLSIVSVLGALFGASTVAFSISGTLSGSSGSFAPNYASVSAGMSTIIDRQWNPTDPTIPGGVLPPASLSGSDSKGMQWYNGGSGPVPIINTPASLASTIGAAVPAVPDANATVMAIKYPSGFAAGNLPFGCFKNSPPTVQKLYFCCYVCMPTNFNSNGNNIKWVFFQQDGGGANHVLMLSSGPSGSYVGPWLALQGGGGSNNVGGNNNTKTGWVTKLTTPSVIADSSWHCIEWYVQRETTPGVSADGVFKSWVDGTLNNHWANLNYNATSGSSNGFQTMSFEPYYGGGGSAAPANEYICIGRTFCAGV